MSHSDSRSIYRTSAPGRSRRCAIDGNSTSSTNNSWPWASGVAQQKPDHPLPAPPPLLRDLLGQALRVSVLQRMVLEEGGWRESWG
jgi:hypothetical protein